MSMLEMTVASASTPDFFLPFEKTIGKDKQFFISGDNIAASPAMFAFMNAVEKRGKDPSNIRMVSVGSTNTRPIPFSKNVGLLEWASRITTLSQPVKKSTMDYMTRYLAKKHHRVFHKY
jgi:hypothetical protein